ncbi:MAG: bifunctional [glutamate--ammonia ligase]-adenylyl-L-tyrosine phosphorylase/[glutamate--ammonia-ligase] adenylyltransferase [Nitrospinae bacterium]|nr:bifunctional [glutamate--ammonia ligase]-adenylyl-L-tyrosine phosphorylase/[glutamate--ammonia-ligase] adenylyltransferase [Nitrospinota bacterium]
MSVRIEEHPGFTHIEKLLPGGAPTPAAKDLLALIGVSDPVGVTRNLQSLALHPAFPRNNTEFLLQLLSSLRDTFDPERALSNFERILGTRDNPDALLKALTRSDDRRAEFFALAGGSQFLIETILRHPHFLDWLLRPGTLRATRTKEKMVSELWKWVRENRDARNGPENAMRRFRQREYLRIAVLDLMRQVSLMEVTTNLSYLADTCLEVAVRIARSELEQKYGKPRYKDADGRWRNTEFSVIGMGKLGGLELNFSSDIDLIFVYSSDEGQTTGVTDPHTGRTKRSISNHEFFAHLSRRLISLMATNTEEGHVFRIDTRLRPEGSQGALAYSLRSCEVYYESWGETWERQALIKSRHCAGSEALSDDFMEMIRPFVYRRTMDISVLEEIGRIKGRINENLKGPDAATRNVKLGEGGIREIEFITQALQLIYGGRETLLQNPSTLEGLSMIEALGLLPAHECDQLSNAYVFLRDVEHRVQVTHGLQTHEIPADEKSLSVLARKMDCAESAELKSRLAYHQNNVSRIFENMFRNENGDEETVSPSGPPTPALTLEDSLSAEDLASYNFVDPEGVSTHLKLLRNGASLEHVSAKAKRIFDELLPRLLYQTLDLPEPDRAIAHLNKFVERGGGRESILGFMAEQEESLEIILKLFASSNYLAEVLIEQPGLLETLFQRETLAEPRSEVLLDEELRKIAGAQIAPEEKFNRLHLLKKSEELAIGIRSILGAADILETLSALSHLAEATLKSGYEIACERMLKLYGVPMESETGAEARFAIIGLGKMGSGEMNYGSDLDLIFVYSAAGNTSGQIEGKPAEYRPISNHEFYIKVATFLRDGLAASGSRDRTYEMDLRLRPEGEKGALAAPTDVFIDYFNNRAEIWERQALTRSRYVAGSQGLGADFMALVNEFVYERESPADLVEQVRHMRGRIEKELSAEDEGIADIKLGRGGIIDIEFLTQYLLIQNGGAYPEIRVPNTYLALQALNGAGLLADEDTGALLDGYRFLRLVENRLRIGNAQSINIFLKTKHAMNMLARRMNFVDDMDGSANAKLLAQFEKHTDRVREVYEKVVVANT